MEQTLLTLFPQERPVYPDTPPGETTNWCSPFPGEASGAPPGRCCAGGRPRPPVPGGCRRTAGGGPSGIHPAHPPDPPAGLLPGCGGLPGDRASLGDALRGPPGEAPHPPWRPGPPPPGGGHAAGPIPGLPLRRQLAMDCAQASLAVKRDLKPQEISLYVGIPFFVPPGAPTAPSSPPRGQPTG